ncbi:TIGR03619 family F420-dependent LLM class oxidoreductase [Nonomuraea sp. KC401]|uniref:TIGR03619 family F420-dependent LLM class oxidoreductase n=1 Tax=unclassified Nonomuraea TaxID=2593643 RepID=UPI0010FCEB46|nr:MULTISPECIES: TIGR03619 family F420-dependent LLM class oxidoreductase [unclassified Nonomuraea]NBE94918.1 TIGR03619 family F420-dependent LLM class oxidoreductase [Nonomuraea sp. K271]TLF74684.1 TIGR03619 family F420-dependent LLM class oxidoreductase [Nonomuraea sp. KC401]
MELGVALPTSGPLATPAGIARVAREAERLGYDSVWTYERLLRPTAPVSMGGGEPQPVPEIYRSVYEPLETLSYVAALTERVKLGTSIIDALLHPAVVLAKRFATLDQLSGGRVVAGLGQGWMPQEFAAANVPMSRIGPGMDEVIAAMRACWGPDPVAYDGTFTQIAESEINPKPVQAHVPILLGAMTPAGVRRAARVADGLNPVALSHDMVTGLAKAFRSAVAEGGRDPESVTVVARANVPLTAAPLGDDRPFLGGSPRQIAADLEGLEGTGIDHVLFSTIDPDAPGELTGLDEMIDLYAELIGLVRG